MHNNSNNYLPSIVVVNHNNVYSRAVILILEVCSTLGESPRGNPDWHEARCLNVGVVLAAVY